MLNGRIRDPARRRAGRAVRPDDVEVPLPEGTVPDAGVWAAPACSAPTAQAAAADPEGLTREVSAPPALVVEYRDAADLLAARARPRAR